MVLRNARLLQGYGLREVERALNIRLGHLEALEERRFRDLPPLVYAKGFVAAYASFLNLDKDDLVTFAEQFSKSHDIVTSQDWLNLVEENGLGGAGRPASFSFSEHSKKLMSEARKGKPAANRGKPHTEESKQKMSKSSAHKGKKLSPESIAKRTATCAAKLVKRRKTVCPHCGKEGSVGASMLRWHFDNCKLKE
jgi:hypothetical protein